MPEQPEFDIRTFLPYLLAQAADAQSLAFQRVYKGRYGMLRTEWRVLFHLGRYGAMTATEICDRGRLHKTKVSRAVKALEAKRYLTRSESSSDRRQAILSLTRGGEAVFRDLAAAAQAFDADLDASLPASEAQVLRRCLLRLAAMDATIRLND